MDKHILFITSSNLATNPRCLKEIRLAVRSQFKVSVIKFSFSNWSQQFEESIEQSLPEVKFYCINAGRKPLSSWLLSSFLSVVANWGSRLFPASVFLNGRAAGKRVWLIMNAINKSAVNADFIVGHNPAAFWPAYTLAKKRKVPFAIDLEDYHPGEFDKGHKKRIMEELMSKVLPSAKYVSFASNLILQETLQKIPAIRKGIVIDNCFERGEFLPIQKEADNGKLQLVWFSQNINYLRGLELVLPVLAKFKEQLTVTLVGNLNAEFAKWLEPYSSFTKVISPLAQVDLHHLLRNFDVGLAIEDPKANMNRDICLTNKIWSYFQSGLFILASTTKAQKEFLHQHNPHGKLFDLNAIDSLDQAIEYLIKNKDDIRHQKGKRYNRALRYSWENEADKLIAEWREVVVG